MGNKTLTHENFDKRELPKGFKPEIQNLVAVAVTLGWRLIITSNAGLTLVSQNDAKRIHLSSKRKSGPVKRLVRDIIKFGDPVRVNLVTDLSALPISDEEYGTLVANVLSDLGDDMDVSWQTPADEPEEAPVTRRRAKAAERAAAIEQAAEKKGTPKPERTVVSEKPMLARAHEGRAYESKIAIEPQLRRTLAAVEGDGAARVQYALRHRIADPAGAAGNDGDALVQVQLVHCLLSC